MRSVAPQREAIGQRLAELEAGIHALANDVPAQLAVHERLWRLSPETPALTAENTLLVHAQLPDATLLATETAWRARGYEPVPGQRPAEVMTLQPRGDHSVPRYHQWLDTAQVRSVEDEDTRALRCVAAMHDAAYVHDLSVYHGGAGAEPGVNLLMLGSPHISGVYVDEQTPLPDGSTPKAAAIAVRPHLPAIEQAAVAAHELAHAVHAHRTDPGRPVTTDAYQEIVAQATAWSVLDRYGISHPPSLVYVQRHLARAQLPIRALRQLHEDVHWGLERML